MVTSAVRQSGEHRPAIVGWIGIAALTLGTAAFGGSSGVGTYRSQTIIDNPCTKNALESSSLETWLTATGSVLLAIAVGAFAAVLIAASRSREALARHIWAGLVAAILLLVISLNVLAGDPLGWNTEPPQNCATMLPIAEIR